MMRARARGVKVAGRGKVAAAVATPATNARTTSKESAADVRAYKGVHYIYIRHRSAPFLIARAVGHDQVVGWGIREIEERGF